MGLAFLSLYLKPLTLFPVPTRQPPSSPPTPSYNGRFVCIISSSGGLLMSRKLHTLLPFSHRTVWPSPCQSGVISHEGLSRTCASTGVHAAPIICLLWSAARPALQAALAPSSRVKKPLSWPMFVEPLMLPPRHSVSERSRILPRCHRCYFHSVICQFTLDGGLQRGKLNMFKAIHVISAF